MRKIHKFSSIILLGTLMVSSISAIGTSISFNNAIKAHAIDASLYDYSKCNVNIPTNYYRNVDMSADYEEFADTLSSIISYPYTKVSYDRVGKEVLHESDMDPENPDNQICLYTGQSLTGGWSREHVWCKSHGFSEKDTLDPYSDAHHLRVTNQTANAIRNNSDYGEVSGKSYTTDIYGNKYTSSIYEPRDEIKGDCARMIFYVATRYRNVEPYNARIIEGSSMSYTGNDYKNGLARFGFLSTLLKWHYEDPVSVDEIYRNNVVYKYQKNRNPFIDHPEYVEKCWDVSRIPGYTVSTSINQSNLDNLNYAVQHLPSTVSISDESDIYAAFNLYKGLNNNEKSSVNSDIYTKLMNSLRDVRQLRLDEKNSEFIKTTYFKDANFVKDDAKEYQRNITATFNEEGNDPIYFSAISWYISCATYQLSLGYNVSTDNSHLNNLGFSKRFSAGEYFLTQYSYTNMKTIEIFMPAPKRDLSNFKGWDLFIKQDDKYTVLKSGNTLQFTVSYTFENATDGQIGLLIYGSQAAICLQSLTVITDDVDKNIRDLKEIQTKASLSYSYDVISESSVLPSEVTNFTTDSSSNASLLGFSNDIHVDFYKTNTAGSNATSSEIKLYKNDKLKFSCDYPIISVSFNSSSESKYNMVINAQFSLDGENYRQLSDYSNITVNGNCFYIYSANAQIRFSSITIKYANIQNAALRFGLLLSYDKLQEIEAHHNISGYGVLLAKTSTLNGSTFEEIIDANKNTYTTDSSMMIRLNQLGINTECKERLDSEGNLKYHFTNDSGNTIVNEGESIIFRAYLPVPKANYNTPITACAYFIIDGKYILLGEREESVASQAQKYTGYTGDINDTLSYLSSLA